MTKMIKSIHGHSLPGVLPSSNPFAGGVAGVLLVLCLWLTSAVLPVNAAPGGTVVSWAEDDAYHPSVVPAAFCGVTAIAAGNTRTVALKSDGTVVAWGLNQYGATTGTPTTNLIATANPVTLNGQTLIGVTAIAAGDFHTVALKSDGTVVAWGYNYFGQTDVPIGLTGVTAIAAGDFHTVALKSDGTVVAWGKNDYGQATVPAGLSGVTAIAAGDLITVALKNNGTVVAWGVNYLGSTTVPAGLSGVTAIAAGDLHTVALKSDGTVVQWGPYAYGTVPVPAGLSGVTAIAAGNFYSMALKSDGTVVEWGFNGFRQPTVPAGLSGVTAIAVGYEHTVALVRAPDLIAGSMSWNKALGGLDFTYFVQGSLANSTTARVFWANGTTTNNILSPTPVYTVPIPAGFCGQDSAYVPESFLENPPASASYLLLVLDSNNFITESTKLNNTIALRNTFRHVVLVMMENRSFDHFLGWLPGANGRQLGKTYTNASGQSFTNWPLAPFFQGCGCGNPDESFGGGRTQFNNGACDGWLRVNTNDTFSIGYYVQTNLSFLGQAATNWTVCDNYFAAVMAETHPNRIYQHAAQTDLLRNRTKSESILAAAGVGSISLPTIWDSLSRSNISGRYYHSGTGITGQECTFLNLWGAKKYFSITRGIDQFYQDCADGNLPAVSFVDPLFEEIDAASGNDDHPHSDIRKGEEFLASIYNAIVSSPNWSSTVLIINFDEWGGFFDHVPPPNLGLLGIPPAEASLGNDGQLGFRVPCLVISPWSRRRYVSKEQFDHTSVLKLIENHWGLPPLTIRDQNANDLADVLDLNLPNFTRPPRVITPPGPWGGPCRMLQITPQTDQSLFITWDATCENLELQTAMTLAGPWTNVTISVSPYVLRPEVIGQFYRLVKK